MIRYTFSILLFLFFAPLFTNAQSEFVYSSIAEGESPKDWTDASAWERDFPALGWPPNVPGHPATHSNLAGVEIYGYVNVYSGGLSVTNANPFIEVIDTLFIRGNVTLGSGASMNVVDGGILVIDGNLTLEGSFNMGNLGNVVVTGNLNVTNGSISNNSNMYVYGSTNLTGGGLINGCGGWSGCSMEDYQIGTETDLANDNESLYDFVDSDGVVLPIVLTSFTVTLNEKQVRLSWTTAKEEDFSHFEIERSIDGGKHFEQIGVIEGYGNSVITQSYNYKDMKAPFGQLYYRLRAVDIDGSFEYSPILKIEKPLSGLLFATPNPVEGRSVFINTPDGFGEKIQRMELYSMRGERLILKEMQQVNQTVSLPADTPAGMYLIRITHNGLVENVRIVLQ